MKNKIKLTLIAIMANLQILNAQDIVLPKPDTTGGKPLMETLKKRSSSRSFSSKDLSLQELSNLLWAADGINRPNGKRTAPSANAKYYITIYVALKSGVYLYDVPTHTLKQLFNKDIREKTGTQEFNKTAPVDLIYIGEGSKYGKAEETKKMLYYGVDSGEIAENVYLYCASAGLSNVIKGSFDREMLTKELQLKEDQFITFTHAIGYPGE
ncbi:MAG: nitroreductase family protein [Bacteroidales bacterium]|nr:nitroreductase family protein [Bacteroidales bacterium]